MEVVRVIPSPTGITLSIVSASLTFIVLQTPVVHLGFDPNGTEPPDGSSASLVYEGLCRRNMTEIPVFQPPLVQFRGTVPVLASGRSCREFVAERVKLQSQSEDCLVGIPVLPLTSCLMSSSTSSLSVSFFSSVKWGW